VGPETSLLTRGFAAALTWVIGSGSFIDLMHELKNGNDRCDDEDATTAGCQATITDLLATKAKLHFRQSCTTVV